MNANKLYICQQIHFSIINKAVTYNLNLIYKPNNSTFMYQYRCEDSRQSSPNSNLYSPNKSPSICFNFTAFENQQSLMKSDHSKHKNKDSRNIEPSPTSFQYSETTLNDLINKSNLQSAVSIKMNQPRYQQRTVNQVLSYPFYESPIAIKSVQKDQFKQFKIETVKCSFFGQNQSNLNQRICQIPMSVQQLNDDGENLKTQEFFEQFEKNYVVLFQGDQEEQNQNIFNQINVKNEFKQKQQIQYQIQVSKAASCDRNEHLENQGLALSVNSNFQKRKQENREQTKTERSPSRDKQSSGITIAQGITTSLIAPKQNNKYKHRIIKQNALKNVSRSKKQCDNKNQIKSTQNRNQANVQLSSIVVPQQMLKVLSDKSKQASTKDSIQGAKNIGQIKNKDQSTPPIHNIPNGIKTMRRTFSRTFYSSLNPSKSWKFTHTLKPSKSISAKFCEKAISKRDNIFSIYNFNKIVQFNPHNPQTGEKCEKEASKPRNVWRYTRKKRSQKQNKDGNININVNNTYSIQNKIKTKKMQSRDQDNIFKNNFILGNHLLRNTWCQHK